MAVFNPLADLEQNTKVIRQTFSPFELWMESPVKDYTVTMQLLTMGDVIDIARVLRKTDPIEAVHLSKVHTVARAIQEINDRPVVSDELLEEYNKEHARTGFDKIGALDFKVLFILQFSDQVVDRLAFCYEELQQEYLKGLIGEIPEGLKLNVGGLDNAQQTNTPEVPQ